MVAPVEASSDRSWAFVTTFHFTDAPPEMYVHYGSRRDCERAVDRLSPAVDAEDGAVGSVLIRYPLDLAGRTLASSAVFACRAEDVESEVRPFTEMT